jgi:hypothetical protein
MSSAAADNRRNKAREEIVLNNKQLARMSSSAADRRRAREEYYRGNNNNNNDSSQIIMDSSQDRIGMVNLLSSASSSANNSVTSSSYHGGPLSVLSHVTEGTTETSSRNSSSGANNTNEPPESGGGQRQQSGGRDPSDREDHFRQQQRKNNNNYYQSDSAEDDDDEIRTLGTLATMDTQTFRRLREKRRKSKGSDTDSRSSATRGRTQRNDPPNISNGGNNRRVRYRGGGGGGHGRNSYDEDDYDDGESYDSRSMMTDGVSRFSRATHRSSSYHINRPHYPTSNQWQMGLIFALGLVLVIKAGIVEVKLEKAQLRGISGRGGDNFSHLNHLSGDDYYKSHAVDSSRSLEKEDETDAVEGGSLAETYFKKAVEKLENGGEGVNSPGEKPETEESLEELSEQPVQQQQVGQESHEAADEGNDISSDENDLPPPFGMEQQPRQQLQQQNPLEFLRSQSSLTQGVSQQDGQRQGGNNQLLLSQTHQQSDVQELLEQAQVQSQLAGKSPAEQQLLIDQFRQFLEGTNQQRGEQIQQPQQQNLFDHQQQQQQQTQHGHTPNQFELGHQQSPEYYQYGQVNQQQGQYLQQQQQQQQQNPFGQQLNQQNNQQYGQQPQQVQQQHGQQPQQVQQQYSQQPPQYNQQHYHPQQNLQLSQQFEPQLHQDVQQQVFAVQSTNYEVASQGNVVNAKLNAYGNESSNLSEYSPVGNVDAIDANTDLMSNSNQLGAEIGRNLSDEDIPPPPPPVDELNNRLVPFDVSRQPRFQGHKNADDQEGPDEHIQDVPIQVQPDVYGTLKEVEPLDEKPIESQLNPNLNNPDLNYKAYVVNDGIAFTNPRLWGAKTLTTPGLRSHLSKNDAKFAAAV